MIDLASYRHRSVRDLAWAIASAPLLEPRHRGVFWPDATWYRRRYEEYAPTLALLDKDPGTLDHALAERPGRNLGGYFEALLAFWFATTPRFRLLERNLIVRSGGRTIGEFDLLVRDVETDRTWHVETAVKFYLGIPAATGRAQAHWLGSNASDRLSDKIEHLRKRQTRLFSHPAARARLAGLGIEPDGVMVLMKGRLFYPHRPAVSRYRAPHAVGPQHLHGTWYERADFVATFGETRIRWTMPGPRFWLSPHIAPDEHGELLRSQALAAAVDSRPIAAIGLHEGVEVQRCFVAPDRWPPLHESC